MSADDLPCGCRGRNLCSYHEGAADERARIVAWLRTTPLATTVGQSYAEKFADAIEAGECDDEKKESGR